MIGLKANKEDIEKYWLRLSGNTISRRYYEEVRDNTSIIQNLRLKKDRLRNEHILTSIICGLYSRIG